MQQHQYTTYKCSTDLKSNIERILSDILSQKHEAKIALRFEKKEATS